MPSIAQLKGPSQQIEKIQRFYTAFDDPHRLMPLRICVLKKCN